MKTRINNEFEEATQNDTSNQGSTSAFVAMVAADVILLLMFVA